MQKIYNPQVFLLTFNYLDQPDWWYHCTYVQKKTREKPSEKTR